MVLHANGSRPVIPLYLPVPPVMTWVPQFISGWLLSRSRVSKVEKILSPSVSARMQAPSMYFLSPDATFSATQRADILSSIFSPFMFWVVPTASSMVAFPSSPTSRFCTGRKMKWVTYGVVPFFWSCANPCPADNAPETEISAKAIILLSCFMLSLPWFNTRAQARRARELRLVEDLGIAAGSGALRVGCEQDPTYP